jgi:pimeloyl-ACP methyl ester carboxylesterase
VKRLLVTLVAAALLAAVPASAAAEPEHAEPQGPAKVAFAADFPALVDHEWGFPLGGFGGVSRGAPRTHVPVIFVHGNAVDAADWYPVRDAFRAAGWSDQELWALSYNGLGGNNGTALLTANPEAQAEHQAMGWDGQVRVTNNEVNVPDLYDLIVAVRSYTGSDEFTLVTHSLGVTLARRTLKVHPELRDDLVAFVGIAGGNHGTSLCPPGSEEILVSCDEGVAGSAWLTDLNGPAGADETYRPASWLTIYDGSGAADPAFAGPTYAESPRLEGADNRAFAGTYHNDLRLSPAIVAEYRTFIEAAESAVTASQPPSAPVAPSPPAASSGAGAGAGAFSSPGGFVAPSAPAGPVTSPPSPPTAESGGDAGTPGVEQVATVATTRVSTVGRHWSGAANGAMVLLLALGVALLVLDRRRRRANQEVVA